MMAQDQSALGGRVVNRMPSFNTNRLARVTSIKDFHKLGKIEVVFLDYSQPAPVWVVGDIDREPVEGDMVVVGYLDNRKDAPYLQGFVKNGSYTTNFMVLKRDKIKLQLPVFDIGVKDGTAHNDVKGHLLDNSKQNQRAYVELTPTHAIVSFPTSEDGSTAPATVKITASEVVIDHPTGKVKHHGGAKEVARKGDTVQINVGGTDYNGVITSGSAKTMID